MPRREHKRIVRLNDSEAKIADEKLAALGYRSIGHFVRTMLVHGKIDDFGQAEKTAGKRQELFSELKEALASLNQCMVDLHQGLPSKNADLLPLLPRLITLLKDIDALEYAIFPSEFKELFRILGKTKGRFYQAKLFLKDDAKGLSELSEVIALSRRIRAREQDITHADR